MISYKTKVFSSISLQSESQTWVISHIRLCSLAILNPRVGHTTDIPSPFISVLSFYQYDRRHKLKSTSIYCVYCWSPYGLVVKVRKKEYLYTHTHPFNGPLSRTTQVSRYQKGKTSLDSGFYWSKRHEWQRHQLGHMQVCTSLQTDTTPAPYHSIFYRLDALPVAQPTVSKHWMVYERVLIHYSTQ